MYVWTPPICLDTPTCLHACHMFGCPHMFGCTPTCLNVPYTSICPCSPVHLYISRGYLHMIWGWGAPIHPILSAQKLIQG